MLVLLAVIVAGCGNKLPDPVAINEGVDKCEVCNMMIKDDQHATQLILKNGKALKFDDIGDLYAWTKKNGLNDVEVRYVRDYNSKEWIKLEDATFAYDESFETPMAFGVYSFKNKKDAEAFIEDQHKGKLMSATDLDNHNWESNMDHSGHGHGDGDHGDGGHSEHGENGEHSEHGEHGEHGENVGQHSEHSQSNDQKEHSEGEHHEEDGHEQGTAEKK